MWCDTINDDNNDDYDNNDAYIVNRLLVEKQLKAYPAFPRKDSSTSMF